MATVETETITDFLLRLGEDESLLTEFARDTQLALEASSLDEQSVAALLSGDLDRVRSAVEADVAHDPVHRRIVTAPRMMIAPEPEPDEPEPDEPEPDEPEPDEPKPESAHSFD